MKFNISYFGHEPLFHLRRDFILVLKYALEDLGHNVVLSGQQLDGDRFNLVIGGYFLPDDQLTKLATSGIPHAHVNTEVIRNDMLNLNPRKVNFLGSYLPAMQKSAFVWDVIMDNMDEHQRYGTRAHFLRWGWHPKMRDIEHRQEKDLDIYFFGMLSERRKKLLMELGAAGISGAADHSCPYFLRNDRISRARVQLNLIQEDKYTHVNSFRICYLANNACCVLSESEQDPASYLQFAEIIDSKKIVEEVRYFLADNRWKWRGEKAAADFAKRPMRELMEALMEISFGKSTS